MLLRVVGQGTDARGSQWVTDEPCSCRRPVVSCRPNTDGLSEPQHRFP